MSDDSAHDGEGVLRRWSRRKRTEQQNAAARAKRGTAAPAEVVHAPPATTLTTGADGKVAVLAPEATRPRTGEEEEAIRDLPPVDSLGKDSDYAAFLKKGVPEDLKRQALRKLWATDPQFNVIDPFTEYGGDYTQLVPIDPLKQTIYKVGLGFLNQIEMDAQKGETALKKTSTEDALPAAPTADAPIAVAAAQAEDGTPQPSVPHTTGAADVGDAASNTGTPASPARAEKDIRSS